MLRNLFIGILMLTGASVGLYWLDENTAVTRQWSQQLPLLEKPVEFGVQTGKQVTRTTQALGNEASGYVFTMTPLEDWGNDLEKQQQQIAQKYPVVSQVGEVVSQGAATVYNGGLGAVESMQESFFPKADDKAKQAEAKARLYQLKEQLELKKQEKAIVETEIKYLESAIRSEERLANPLMRWVPGNPDPREWFSGESSEEQQAFDIKLP